jgi:hypothetical protein
LTPDDQIVLKGLVFPGMIVEPQPVAMPGATSEKEGDAS